MRISDWSSDVCSSDLSRRRGQAPGGLPIWGGGTDASDVNSHFLVLVTVRTTGGTSEDRKSVVSGTSVPGSVDLGGRRLIKKTSQQSKSTHTNHRQTLERHHEHTD